jgi:hypothetical protein
LERLTAPVKDCPGIASVAPGADNLLFEENVTYAVDVNEPAAPSVHDPESLKSLLVPAQVMVKPATVARPVPAFARVIDPADAAVAQVKLVEFPPVEK